MDPTNLPIENPTRILLFTGKGGAGKTSLACATAIGLATDGQRILLVSTDPASNLDEVLQADIGTSAEPVPVPGVENLHAFNIDPEAAAHSYRERVVGPYRELLPQAAVASIEEQLSGACTVEIAAFDEFTKLVADPGMTGKFDHVIFDTAPTGHTLRLLRLPAAWTGFIDTNTTGTSCLGPLAGLQTQKSLYDASLSALTDPSVTTLILVSRPDRASLAEAYRSGAELAEMGLTNQRLFLNGVFNAQDGTDDGARALEERGRDAVASMPAGLAALPRTEVPLLPYAPLGVENLAAVFRSGALTCQKIGSHDGDGTEPGVPLAVLIDELEAAGRGVIMTMGKGGTGKTTVASAIAVELAHRGHAVYLSTTDPAAHVADAVGGAIPNLSVSRIDPAAETREYTETVLGKSAPNLDEQGMALLEEDLRSPCTEEIAVFSAFARAVAKGENGFVVLDTAPTGHTILLLDAAEAYHREVSRTLSDLPDAVRNLLPRLRDPEFTRVLLVTLPEATPVHEAARLQDDLKRAGITPFAWIVNQTFSGKGFTDPVLAERGQQEWPYLAEVRDRLSRRMAMIPWNAAEPVGACRLRSLTMAGT